MGRLDIFINVARKPIHPRLRGPVKKICRYLVDHSQVKEFLGENRSVLAQNLKVELYQFNQLSSSYKVQNYLKMNNIKYDAIEVSLFSGKELNNRKYKDLPMAVINGIEVIDSRLILSILESHLITGKSIDQILQKYRILDRSFGNSWIVDPYVIDDVDPISPQLSEYRKREFEGRCLIHETIHNSRLLLPNIFYTFKESNIVANVWMDAFKIPSFLKVGLEMVGGPAAFALSTAAKKFYKHDYRKALFSAVDEWLLSVGDRDFHGGSSPNLADIEMFSIIDSLQPYPVFEDIMKNVKDVTPWYLRMHALKTKSIQ
ncbi:Prostaglandin E synthase 2 [Thelohanellus kitauei]|uniref:Prostaglandin E synthase 2 n=1 Tax=Thelohanellus kitauei TaxID=669202 RepID=A0A0C2IHQ7_THEKT|nr:Prostaglandin E synthase 2 [Thelohanellus kitauei]